MASRTIPRLLDAPSKFLYFDADVGMLFLAGALLGIVGFDSVAKGTLIGIAIAYAWSRIKSGRHPAFHLHLLYWHTPWSLRRTPPSYLREFIG